MPLESSIATAPVTCGAAMEVPDMVRLAVDDEVPADVMYDPGAKISTHAPGLYRALVSYYV